MPFKSDAQRKFLWSQKPEVAKQIAYKDDGGWVENWAKKLDYANPKSYDHNVVKEFLQKAYDARQKNTSQVETPAEVVQRYEPPKPESRWSADWNIPSGHALGADWNTYGS